MRTQQELDASQNSHSSVRVHALIVFSLLVLFGALFAWSFHSKKEVSEVENRRLAEWPVLSRESLLDGQYAKNVETYISDHFPGRAWLTELAFAIKAYRGIHVGDRVIQVKGAETGFEDTSKWAGANGESDVVVTEEPEQIASQSPEKHVPQADKEDQSTKDLVRNVTEVVTKVAIHDSVKNDDPAVAEKNLQPQPVQANNVTPPNVPAEGSTSPVAHTPETLSTPATPSTVVAHSVDPIQSSPEQTAPTPDSAPAPIDAPIPTASSTTSSTLTTPVTSVASAKPVTPVIPVIPAAPIATTSPVAQATQAPPVAKVAPVTPASTQPTASVPKQSNTQTRVAPQTTAKPLNVVGGVLLHDGQALFMFQGTDRGAQGYANAVNTWVELVAKKYPGMTSTVVVTPTSSHFYLPPAARARTTSEPQNLAAMRAALLPEVRFADVVAEMEGHQDQPLFYKSDHHWTGLGAYYAYRAWAKAAGVTPLELSAFNKRSVPGVAGSFWSLTQAPELRNADKESYYYVPTTVQFDGTQYAGPQQKTPVPQPFFAEKSRGYIVFLGGDIPLLVSNTSAGTGRTALVVKNSYGNAFAPYLLPHFDRVVVLDYRYVSRNIQDIVQTFGVTDLVFVNATITANSGAHQERMRQVARGSSTAWLTEAEKRQIKKQQDAQAQSENTSSSTNTSPPQ